MKNCDLGLENAARGRRPRAAFSRPRSHLFTIRTDPKSVMPLLSLCRNRKLSFCITDNLIAKYRFDIEPDVRKVF